MNMKIRLDGQMGNLAQGINKEFKVGIVYNLDDSTSGGGSGGSVGGIIGGGGGGGSVEVPSLPAVEFTDIDNHWAKAVIEDFAASGYVNGYGDSTFRPNGNMTRAEFVKVINRLFEYTNAGSITFKDVDKSAWYYDEICIGVKAGYIQGKSSTTFDPNGFITREEVAEILTNIKNNKDTKIDKLNQFVDANEVSSWAQSALEGAIEAGYLQGDVDKDGNKTIRPQSNATRAEVVTMLSRIK
jgi:hypothetical protein